jgi:hypothetical protein
VCQMLTDVSSSFLTGLLFILSFHCLHAGRTQLSSTVCCRQTASCLLKKGHNNGCLPQEAILDCFCRVVSEVAVQGLPSTLCTPYTLPLVY